ncbi:MAG: single-stranded DNA-binding protein [Acidimicrobiaceae bacterium]|nr:single-stranded DNA-binding protein [Acidimicrobiia bacterium]MCY4494865.1 single-stranded DNA-binding protein [Acidimicrobiaceae bacterium]
MGFDNTVTVVGNVTRDPELRFTQGGMAVVNFGVAWNKRRNDGEDEVSFFDVTCFRQLAENVADSVSKGARVVIYGTLSQRSWENQQGERRTKVEILADDVAPSLKWASAEVTRNEFRGGSDGGGSGGQGAAAAKPQSPAPAQPQPTYNLDEEPF